MIRTRINCKTFATLVYTLFIVTLTPIAFAQETVGPQRPAETRDRMEYDHRLMYLLADDLNYTHHFLDFLEVNEDQRGQLKQITDRAAKKLAKSMHSGGLHQAEVAMLLGEFRAELSQVLIDFQIDNLECLLSWREVQRKSGKGCVESLPLAFASLGLQPSDRRELERMLPSMIEDFQEKKRLLSAEVANKIRELVPAGRIEEARRMIQLASADSAPIDSIKVDPLDAAIWDSRDFDHLESRYSAQLLWKATTSGTVSEYLGLSNQQVEELQRLTEEAVMEISLFDEENTDRNGILKMAASGDVEGLRKNMASHRRAVEEKTSEVARRIANDVLDNQQRLRLSSYASFRRRWVESGFESEFGALIANAPDAKPLVSSLDEDIAKLHKAIDRLSRESFAAIIAKLPDRLRERFQAEFGEEYYDNHEERRAAWKKFRDLRK